MVILDRKVYYDGRLYVQKVQHIVNSHCQLCEKDDKNGNLLHSGWIIKPYFTHEITCCKECFESYYNRKLEDLKVSEDGSVLDDWLGLSNQTNSPSSQEWSQKIADSKENCMYTDSSYLQN